MTTLTLRDLGFIGGLGGYDTDALTYIAAVEAADGQSLEVATKDAINAFVVGCKLDGIWSAIKASCILAGARTLAGALVPLVGVAPTNFNFVSGDYNRKTGLVGDGSTKYLGTNRNNNADPQNSNHNSAWVSSAATGGPSVYMGVGPGTGETGANNFGINGGITFCRNRTSNASAIASTQPGLAGTSRNGADGYAGRAGGTSLAIGVASQLPYNDNLSLFACGSTATFKTNARLAFYSIGEALDLALLDARVTALITAIGAAF
jgi:hypothetical protein